jgi:dTDP-4-dehydrorhamnose reductase
MRIAVTGRSGQLVSALRELGARHPGVDVVALGRPDLDLARPWDVASALKAVRPDIVVNAAAYTAVDEAEREPDIAMAVNAAGAGAVAAAARALKAPVVQISTDYVFDGEASRPYVETDAVAPLGAYGASKLEGERTVMDANPDHVVLRTSWVFAAEGRNFVRTMLRAAETRAEISVVADHRGCPSYAPDLAEAVLTVCSNLLADPSERALRGIFHLCGHGEASWAEFAEAIFALSERKGGHSAAVRRIDAVDYPTPARRPRDSRLDCSRLAAVHGAGMPHWRDALSRCIDRISSSQGVTS